MATKSRKKNKANQLREIIINQQGVLCELETDQPISCLVGEEKTCMSRCNWLSLDETGIAKCQELVIGKLVSKVK